VNPAIRVFQDRGGLGGDRKEPHPAILLYSVTLVTEIDTL
jgi:hypothetical protein